MFIIMMIIVIMIILTRLHERLQGSETISRMSSTLGEWERGWQGIRLVFNIIIVFVIVRNDPIIGR